MSFSVNELNSARYSGQLVDETGAGFGGAQTLILTLYNKLDLSIINVRNNQNVLNQNQVTYDLVTGALVWNMLPADNPIINDGISTEEHIALFVATWANGVKQMTHEVSIKVKNLGKLP